MTWLRKLSRSANARKQNRKNRQPGQRRQSKLDALNLRIERLEERALLSITTESGATISPVENTAFSGAVATFTSPDNGPFTAVINWGDGNSTSVSGSSITGGPSPAAFTVNGTHTYSDELAATSLVTTITDTSDNGKATATGSVTVGEGDTLVHAATPFTLTGTEGQTASLTATFTNSAAQPSSSSDFMAVIDWGDGTSQTTVSGAAITGAATLTVKASHLYTDELAIDATATNAPFVSLFDDGFPGTANAIDVGSITITEADTLTAAGTAATITATQGVASSATLATFADTYTGAPVSDFTATINWGDGNTGTGVVSSTTPGTLTVSGSHAYAATGAHQATVTLDDVAPGTATATANATVNVSAAPTIAPSVSIAETGPATANSASAVTYTITLTNSSTTNPATNVAFVDQLVTGQAYLAAYDTAGTKLVFNSATEQITGTVASIGPSSSDTVTIVAFASTGTNNASISIPSGNVGTPTTASVTTNVTGGTAPSNIDAVDVSEPLGTFAPGDVLLWSPFFGYDPAGPVPTSVTVAFQLDPNEVLLSVSDRDGSSFRYANGVIIGTVNLAGHTGDQLTIYTSPTAAAAAVGSVTDSFWVAVANGNTDLSSDNAAVTITAPTASAPNVTVTKTGPSAAVVGAPATYTVTLANTGSAAANRVVIGDPLGPNAVLLSASDTANTTFSSVNGEVTGTVTSIAAGTSDTITIVAVPTSAGTLSNTVYTGIGDGNNSSGGNLASNISSPAVNTTVSAAPTGAPSLNITKTGPTPVNVGDLVTYSVKIANSGGTATNVQFNDTFSASNLTIFSVSDTGGDSFSVFNGVVSGTLASIASGATDTITIVAIPTVAGTATDPITVAVPGGNAGMVTTTPNNTTINGAPLTAANVSISKTAPANAVAEGDKLTATVTLTNNGTTPVTNVAFVDSFPGQAFFTASDTNGTVFTFNIGTGEMTGSVASIAAGATDTITIVTVPTSTLATTDTATIGISGGNQAGNTANATATLSAPAAAPDVSVAKTGPKTAVVGSPVTDTITLTNSTGTSTPATVDFIDAVGTNLASVTASDGQSADTFAYSPTTGQITGTMSAAAFAGASGGKGGTATVTVTFTPKSTGTLTDIATIAIPGGNTAGPSLTDSWTTTVTPPLSISKTGTPSTVTVGGTETYTITVSNSGGTAATGAVVTDDVPTGLTNVKATDAAGTATVSGNTVTDNLGTLAANSGTETLTITGTAAALSSGTPSAMISNTASLGYSGTTATSNAVSTTINAATPASLTISKVGTPATVTVGSTETYTITVSNTGGTAATGAVVTDNVPTGLTNVKATDATGTATVSGNTVTDNLGTLAANTGTETLTITGTAAALPGGTPSATISNTASLAYSGTTATSNAVSTTINAATPASLTISKIGTPSTVTVGGTETYTITASNSGGTAATGAVITDDVPTGLTNVKATDAAGTATVSGNTVTDNLGTLAASTGTEMLTITGTAAALSSGTPSATISNTASLAFNGTTATSNAVSTTISATTPASLSISKTGTPSTLTVGGTETYTITVSNSGGTPATGATVEDVVPTGLTLVSATDAAGTVTTSGNAVTDALGTVAASGGAATLTITATAAALPSGTTTSTVSNTASLAFNGTTTPSNAVTTTINTTTTITTGVGFLAGQPGDGTPQTFVQNLYRELLGREPDSSGDAYWVGYVNANNNAAGQSHVIRAFMNSPEYAIHYVTTLYKVFLNRAPDAAGLQFWTQKMGQPGMPGDSTGSADEKYALAAILGSDEFYLDSGNTPQGWINALYEDLLGRMPDGSGAAFWANELATRGSADRDGIVRDLLTTPEAAHELLDGFYPAVGGTAGTPLAAPGTAVGGGSTDLAIVTGGGWENLYLEGPYDSQPEGNDAFFASLAGGGGWDDVQSLLLETSQFYTNPNRPVT